MLKIIVFLILLMGSREAFAQANPWASALTTQSGTSYTLQPSDCGTTVLFTSSSAVAVTLPASMVLNCPIRVVQSGAGVVTVASGSGASLLNAYGSAATVAQNANIDVRVTANSGGSSAAWTVLGSSAPGNSDSGTTPITSATVTIPATYALALFDPTSNAISATIQACNTGLIWDQIFSDATAKSAIHAITLTPSAGTFYGTLTSAQIGSAGAALRIHSNGAICVIL